MTPRGLQSRDREGAVNSTLSESGRPCRLATAWLPQALCRWVNFFCHSCASRNPVLFLNITVPRPSSKSSRRIECILALEGQKDYISIPQLRCIKKRRHFLPLSARALTKSSGLKVSLSISMLCICSDRSIKGVPLSPISKSQNW